MHCAPENATPLPENVNAVSSHASVIVVVPATFLLSQPVEVSHATHRDVVASPQKPARHVLREKGTHCAAVPPGMGGFIIEHCSQQSSRKSVGPKWMFPAPFGLWMQIVKPSADVSPSEFHVKVSPEFRTRPVGIPVVPLYGLPLILRVS